MAATWRLASAGYRVTLVERRPYLGGRAYSFVDRETGVQVDNGQHVFMGCCTAYINFLRDVGTLDSYYYASIDLVAPLPIFDLYNDQWPILTWQFHQPPAKFIHSHSGADGYALNSLVCSGAVVTGGRVDQSILAPGVRVNARAEVKDSVLFDRVDVGERAIVRRAILDKNVRVPAGTRIGVDLDRDRKRFTVSPDGVVVVGKNQQID